MSNVYEYMSDAFKVDKLLADLCSDDGIIISSKIASFRELDKPLDREKAFQGLITLLKDSNPWFRVRAVGALAALGDSRAVKPLIETLDDHDEDADQEMIEARFTALAGFKDTRAIKPLIEQLHRMDSMEAFKLFAFGDAIVLPLIDALHHPNVQIRRQVAYMLGHKRDERVIQPLIDNLGDIDEHVRGQVIASLGYLRSKKAIPFLVFLASDLNPNIREVVAYTLGKIGDIAALPTLELLLNDKDEKVKRMAAESILKLESRN